MADKWSERKNKAGLMDWIDNADSYICPVCYMEVSSPAKYDYHCPGCGFIADRDKNKNSEVKRDD